MAQLPPPPVRFLYPEDLDGEDMDVDHRQHHARRQQRLAAAKAEFTEAVRLEEKLYVDGLAAALLKLDAAQERAHAEYLAAVRNAV